MTDENGTAAEEQDDLTGNDAEVPMEAPKKSRKLEKATDYDTGIVTIKAIGGTAGPITYDFNELPEDMQKKLGPFGMSHKLGDAASSVKGVEAEKAIARVWEGMLKGDWTTRGPATPKIALSEIADNMSNLSPAQQKKAREALENLGIVLPPEPAAV